jgi:hypothetical protein
LHWSDGVLSNITVGRRLTRTGERSLWTSSTSRTRPATPAASWWCVDRGAQSAATSDALQRRWCKRLTFLNLAPKTKRLIIPAFRLSARKPDSQAELSEAIMVDYCARCSRNVNSNSDPSCYALGGVCLCKECREAMLREGFIARDDTRRRPSVDPRPFPNRRE